MGRPHKYENDKHRAIIVKASIPQREFDILVCYANGISIKQISIETGCSFMTVVDIIRRNVDHMVNGSK